MKRAFTVLLAFFAASMASAQSPVADTVHNLSSSGPGELKSQTEVQVCVFCHTPHKAERGEGLWNRRSSEFVAPYQSSTMDAERTPGKGPTSLCLSCHDGTIALGEMLRPPRGAATSDLGGIYLRGRGSFGSNLSNHHPVGISYDVGVVAKDRGLVPPSLVDLPLRQGEVHCTTCHDPHSAENAPFLNKPSLGGELCVTCHAFSGANWNWSSSSHARSEAIPRGKDPWPERKAEWKGQTVGENACENCHASHNSATPERLIKDAEEQTCFRCHDGTASRHNIQSQSQRFYRHPVERIGRGSHDVGQRDSSIGRAFHVECEDCHNPHAASSDKPMVSFIPGDPQSPNHSIPPFANGSIAGVTGRGIDGQIKAEAEYEYEVCLKCHGVPGRSACDRRRCSTALNYDMNRLDEVYNIRDKIDSGNSTLVSYHPLESNNPSNDMEVPSLRLDIPLRSHDSLIYCGDCHSGDNSPAAGGQEPGGPHGSRHEGMLALNYEISPANRFFNPIVGLCFKCHDGGNLFSDESFPHRLHVRENAVGCASCHDPHGSAVYPHLINFMTTASVGGRIYEITGVDGFTDPIWADKGRYAGSCSLNCHGVVHQETPYGYLPEEPNNPEKR